MKNSLRKYNILLDRNLPRGIQYIVFVFSLMGINLREYKILLDGNKFREMQLLVSWILD